MKSRDVSSIDIIVSTNYTPYNHKPGNLFTTIDSILSISDLSQKNLKFNLFVLVDGLQKDLVGKRHIENRQNFLVSIYEFMMDKGQVIVNPEWGHLSGSLSYFFEHFTHSEHVLVVQEDLVFVNDIPLVELLHLLDAYKHVCHIRFNKRTNELAGLDTELSEVVLQGIPLLKTNNWSDNNYLTTRNHFEDKILPRIRDEQTFPENVMRELNAFSPSEFGTYIYGGLGMSQTIKHIGGQNGRLRARFEGHKIVTSNLWLIEALRFAMKLSDAWNSLQRNEGQKDFKKEACE
jgi:hypothetical protein